MHKSFLVYQRLRYLKFSLIGLMLMIVAYLAHQPIGEPPNGGTWLGYTLGGIGAVLILWLMWFGVRKRYYHSTLGTLQGWLSAHVYLGTALVFIATFHAGFQFGWNIHSLSYILMLLVVASGMYGVFVYLRYPERMTQNKGGLTQEIMLREINDLEQECLSLAGHLDKDIHDVLIKQFEIPLVAESLWKQLRMAEPEAKTPHVGQNRAELEKAGVLEKGAVYDATMYLIAERIAQTKNTDRRDRMRRILELLGRKNALVRRLRRSVQFQTILESWQVAHIPLSFGLLAALVVHVVTVFLYW